MTPRRSPQALFNLFKKHQSHWRVYGLGETFVMVEGETDIDLWEKFSSKENCELFYADGKHNITSALGMINDRGDAGVAGIVDADYWLIRESEKLQQKNLLYDKCYPNAELMILSSGALTDVLRTKFHRKDDPDIQRLADLLKTETTHLAMEFGYFRLLNDCMSYGISFSDFWDSRRHNFDEFVDLTDVESVQFRRECFAKRLADFHNAGKSLGHYGRIEHWELLEGVAKLKKMEKYQTPNIKLCQGHETVALIAYLLRFMFKSAFGQTMPSMFNELRDRLKLEKQLRDKYREEDFIATTLYDSIRNWESANSPYRILKPEI